MANSQTTFLPGIGRLLQLKDQLLTRPLDTRGTIQHQPSLRASLLDCGSDVRRSGPS